MDDTDDEFLEEEKKVNKKKNKEINPDSLEEAGKSDFPDDEEDEMENLDDLDDPDVPFNNDNDGTRWQL